MKSLTFDLFIAYYLYIVKIIIKNMFETKNYSSI